MSSQPVESGIQPSSTAQPGGELLGPAFGGESESLVLWKKQPQGCTPAAHGLLHPLISGPEAATSAVRKAGGPREAGGQADCCHSPSWGQTHFRPRPHRVQGLMSTRVLSDFASEKVSLDYKDKIYFLSYTETQFHCNAN